MTRPLAAAVVLAATLPAAASGDEWRSVDAKLEPGKMHESCMSIEAGDKRRYQWKSDAPVDFNIHFHKGAEILYPVKSSGMRGDGGTFVAKESGGYCWMWTARDKPVKLEGRVETK
jgi:hypothetical protein